jgi:hypothetical protein
VAIAEPAPPPPVVLQPAPPPEAPVLSDSDPAPPTVRAIRLTEAMARKQIQRSIATKARACLKTHTTLIKGQQFPVTVAIQPSGEARATATLATSAAARCIADVFKRHRFPVNAGGLSLRYSFTL